MFTELAEKDLSRGEIFGVPAALIVLVIVFGAVLAATMPLVLSVISIVLALALTALIGQVFPVEHLRAQHPHHDGPRGGHRLHAVRHLPLP